MTPAIIPGPVTNSELTSRYSKAHTNNYGTPALALVRGQGTRVWDADGTEYVDFLAGIAVNCLGHAHPAIVEAVTTQLSTLGHASNLYATEPAIRLAERLVDLSGRDGKVFFSNSGAEANESAFKLTRLAGCTTIIAAQGGFHGRTMGALAMTGQPAKTEPFRPLPTDATFVPYGDSDALAQVLAAVTGEGRRAAVILEPILGEAGVVVPPAGYLADVAQACSAHGAFLIIDEVQTGIGRTGAWFAHNAEINAASPGVPDVITLAKGLGGGLPIGATIAFGEAADLFTPGSHGSTFGGNPVSCAAALAVLDTIERDGLLDHVTKMSAVIRERVLAIGSPLVDHVRGRGLLLGVGLTVPLAAEVEAAARRLGLLINAPTSDTLRLAPPLIIDDVDVDLAVQRLARALDDVAVVAA